MIFIFKMYCFFVVRVQNVTLQCVLFYKWEWATAKIHTETPFNFFTTNSILKTLYVFFTLTDGPALGAQEFSFT